jgi:RimJ/RimL family protein N-acetyltransferase
VSGTVFLEGDAVDLYTPEEAHVEFLHRAINDRRVWTTLAQSRPHNRQQERAFAERVAEGDDVQLVVRAGDDPVGVVGLTGIDRQHGHAVLGYWIAPEHWNRGYATDAATLLVGYGFDHLRLHRVEADVYEHNPASARVLEMAGFGREGVLRDRHYADGDYRDVYRYAVLEDEWGPTGDGAPASGRAPRRTRASAPGPYYRSGYFGSPEAARSSAVSTTSWTSPWKASPWPA